MPDCECDWDQPSAAAATMRLLFTGYAAERVASSIGSVQDGAARVIIDPGMAPSQRAILDSLASLGVAPEAITDVIFSHHHPDHTLNAALFPNARFHDHWAIYRGDLWIDRPAEGYVVSPSIRLIETLGHTPQDMTTLVGTSKGVVAFTHLRWHANGPAEDPLASDFAALHTNRARTARGCPDRARTWRALRSN